MPDRGPQIDIPPKAAERPAWSRVGIIGIGGFVVGILWPKLLGVSIGPDVPGGEIEERTPEAAALEAVPEGSGGPQPAGSAPTTPLRDPVSNKQQVIVGDGEQTGCRDGDNKKVEKCDGLRFDRIAKERLGQLAKCPSALGLEGSLSIGFDIDFKSESVTVVKGEDTTLPSSTVAGVLKCAGEELEDLDLKAIPHEHRGYKIHALDFYPPGKSPPSAKPEDEKAKTEVVTDENLATVSWDTALLRSRPVDGDIVARVLQGTRVTLVERQDDWYKVDTGTATGWVYKQAVGLE